MRVDPETGEHNAVEHGVGLTAAAAIEMTVLPASRGTLDGTDPAQRGEGRLTVQPSIPVRVYSQTTSPTGRRRWSFGAGGVLDVAELDIPVPLPVR